MNTVLIISILGIGSLCLMLVVVFYLYAREKARRLLLEADKAQTEFDQKLNEEAEKELAQKKKNLKKRTKTIDPINPWEGVPKREKE